MNEIKNNDPQRTKWLRVERIGNSGTYFAYYNNEELKDDIDYEHRYNEFFMNYLKQLMNLDLLYLCF